MDKCTGNANQIVPNTVTADEESHKEKNYFVIRGSTYNHTDVLERQEEVEPTEEIKREISKLNYSSILAPLF